MYTFHSKKTLLFLLFALAALAVWPGCGNDDEGGDGPECNISGAAFTYNAQIKGIVNRHCISCHATGSGVTGADIFDFTTYEGMKDHLDEGHMLDRVVIKKDMPQSGSTMTQAERDSFNCWIQSGYPKQ